MSKSFKVGRYKRQSRQLTAACSAKKESIFKKEVNLRWRKTQRYLSYLKRPRIASKIALTIACASKEAPAKPRIFSIISKIVANMCDVLPSPLIRQLLVSLRLNYNSKYFCLSKGNWEFCIFFNVFWPYYKQFVNKIYK